LHFIFSPFQIGYRSFCKYFVPCDLLLYVELSIKNDTEEGKEMLWKMVFFGLAMP